MESPSTLDREHRAENKIVEGWLLAYEERKRRYMELRAAIILASGGGEVPSTADKHKTSDPTGRKAIQLAELDEKTGKWIELIEYVQQRLPWHLSTLLQLRRAAHKMGHRGRGRPSWIPFVQQRFCGLRAARDGLSLEDAWINSPGVFSSWWHRIVDITAREAVRRGLL